MTTVFDEFEVMDGWRELPFRAVAQKVSESGYPELESLSVFLDAGVVPRSSREDNHNQLGASLEKYQRVLPNDLVFNKLRTWQGGFGISKYKGIVSPAYIIARPDCSLIEPRFLGYLLKSKPYLSELTRLSKWMPPTQFDISWESIRDLKLRIPSIEEQIKIADYLDYNCGNIQKIVQLRESQIALQPTLIQDFLAHAIHPQMPSKKLKYLADIRVSNVDKHMVDGELGVAVCNYVDVYRNRKISSNIQFMKSTASLEQIRRFSLRRGDIVFTKDSETAEDIAATSFIDEDIENLVLGYHCGVLKVFDIDPSYLYWAIQSPYVKNQFRVSATGVTRVGLKLDDIGLVDIPIADKVTQLEIVEDIRKVVEQSDRYLSFANSQVLALKELKESLITGAVTGQFEVTSKRSVA